MNVTPHVAELELWVWLYNTCGSLYENYFLDKQRF